MRTLAIGERLNYTRYWKPAMPEHQNSFELRLKIGFYNRGPRLDFLKSLGVKWDDGINLLWPSPVAGEWDDAAARSVVEELLEYVLEYDQVLLFGSRVCRAFGIPFEIGKVFGKFVPLPHPSGRCRLWNDKKIHKTVRQVMKKVNLCQRPDTRSAT